MTRIWQIAGGDRGHDCTRLFIRHDLMLAGPGQYGSWDDNKKRYKTEAGKGVLLPRDPSTIRSFAQDPESGDIVLLRQGAKALAIGVIPPDTGDKTGYFHCNDYDDIYGWNLGHARRVIWQDHLKSDLDNLQTKESLFPPMGKTFCAVIKARARVEPLMERVKQRSLRPLPSTVSDTLDIDEVGAELFSKGLSNDAVDEVIAAIKRQRRLMKWYHQQGKESHRPSEHEVVAHMVLPLLLALGWSEQLLAVEWSKIDLAAFSGTPTTTENCVLVCEAKQMKHGMSDVFEQALKYVRKNQLTKCRNILLTQGGRLYLYVKSGRKWPEKPTGYVNIHKIRTSHLLPENTNAIDTLIALTPAGIQQAR